MFRVPTKEEKSNFKYRIEEYKYEHEDFTRFYPQVNYSNMFKFGPYFEEDSIYWNNINDNKYRDCPYCLTYEEAKKIIDNHFIKQSPPLIKIHNIDNNV